MKNKKLILSAFSAALLLVGCGNNESDDNEAGNSDGDVVEINFSHRWPQDPRNSFFAEKAAEFEELKDGKVKINVDSVLNDSYKEQIRVLVSNDNLPDIFCSWSGSFASNLVSSGRIKNLDDVMAEDTEWSDKIMESQLIDFTVDDSVYGIPLTIDGKGFFYNTAIFEENGIEEPETYSEFIDVLDQLQAAGYEEPIMEGLTDAWAISHYMGTYFDRLVPEDVRLADYRPAEGEAGEFTDPGYVEGLKLFGELTDYMGETANGIDHEAARNMFINSEVPVIYLQFGEMHYLEDTDVEYSYFNFPEIEGAAGNQDTLTGAPEGFMVSDNAPEEAVEFLKFLTSEEVAADFLADAGQLVAIEGSVTEENASEQDIGAYEMIQGAVPTAWLDNDVDINIADVIMRGGQTLALGQNTPEEIMEEVQQKAATLEN